MKYMLRQMAGFVPLLQRKSDTGTEPDFLLNGFLYYNFLFTYLSKPVLTAFKKPPRSLEYACSTPVVKFSRTGTPFRCNRPEYNPDHTLGLPLGIKQPNLHMYIK